MNTIWSEFVGLFVDDGRLAVAILLWLAVAWLLLPQLPAGLRGVALFVGLAAILLDSARRGATRR